jgi:hypothetical protein
MLIYIVCDILNVSDNSTKFTHACVSEFKERQKVKQSLYRPGQVHRAAGG